MATSKPEKTATATFTMPITLPFDVPQPDCCPSYSVRIEAVPDPIDDELPPTYVAHYSHRASCEIWRFI